MEDSKVTSKEEGKFRTFDDLLIYFGTGPWNLLTFFYIAAIWTFVPMHLLSGAFISPEVPHHCADDAYTGDNNFTKGMEACSYTVSDIDADGEVTLTEKKCSSWVYDNSTFESSLTSEYDMVCDSVFLRATYSTMYMFGCFFGAFFNGQISDRYGRRIVVIGGWLIITVVGSLQAFMTNITAVMVLRFILGISHALSMQIGFVLTMETTEPKYRSWVGLLIAFPWGLGTMAFGGLGYILRDWRHLQLAVCLPLIIIAPLIWFVGESPRWLIVRGYHDKAFKVLETASRWNKKTLPPKQELYDLMTEIERQANDSEKTVEENKKKNMIYYLHEVKALIYNTTMLFRSRKIRIRTFIMYIDYFVASMVFYGLSLSAFNYSADPFVYMAMTGLMEVIGFTGMVPLADYFGRRPSAVAGYFIAGVSLATLAFIPAEPRWLIITLAMVGKCAISGAFQLLYLYICELLPTEIRSQAIGTSNIFSRMGSILAPFITDGLGPIYSAGPSIVFGGFSFLAGIATCFAPETKNLAMPDTVAELEAA